MPFVTWGDPPAISLLGDPPGSRSLVGTGNARPRRRFQETGSVSIRWKDRRLQRGESGRAAPDLPSRCLQRRIGKAGDGQRQFGAVAGLGGGTAGVRDAAARDDCGLVRAGDCSPPRARTAASNTRPVARALLRRRITVSSLRPGLAARAKLSIAARPAATALAARAASSASAGWNASNRVRARVRLASRSAPLISAYRGWSLPARPAAERENQGLSWTPAPVRSWLLEYAMEY